MKIGIIGAMEIEVDALKEKMSEVTSETLSGIQYYSGKLAGVDTVAAVCGIGKVNAAVCAQTMIMRYSPDALINTGVAGGLGPELDIGDIVISTGVVHHDYRTLDDPPGFVPGIDKIEISAEPKLTKALLEAGKKIPQIKVVPGVIASGDQFISDIDENNRIAESFKASAVEMEGAAIGHVCCLNNLPFAVIRSISDSASSDSHVEFWEFVGPAAKNSTELVMEFLSSLS